jgi:hypothetical protein
MLPPAARLLLLLLLLQATHQLPAMLHSQLPSLSFKQLPAATKRSSTGNVRYLSWQAAACAAHCLRAVVEAQLIKHRTHIAMLHIIWMVTAAMMLWRLAQGSRTKHARCWDPYMPNQSPNIGDSAVATKAQRY